MTFIAPTGDFTASRTIGPKTVAFERKYRIVSNSHMDSGYAWAYAWNSLRLKYPNYHGCDLKSVSLDENSESWGQVFEVAAHYEFQEESEAPGYATLSFSTRGGREKKTHSYATIAFPGAGNIQNPPDFHHGIGYNNGLFDGVDVVVPQFGFSLDIDVPETFFGNGAFAYFHSITGKTNAGIFWIFQPGECLFTGMTGNSYRKPNKKDVYVRWYRVSFEFEAMPSVHREVEPFGMVTKRGMDYLWVFHQEKKDAGSGVTIPVPAACYVEQVYETADFSWFNQLRW